jgi:predicted AAA+ superfamily ATPase
VRRALLALEQALIIHKIRPTHAPRLPLAAHAVDKGFKLAFLDIGLLHHLLGFDWTRIAPDADLTDIANGRFAEQFTAQEIIAAKSDGSHYPLHYWSRPRSGSDAEVDFIIEHHNHPAPMEVKSGTKGRLRSLLLYLEELNPPAAFVLSQRNVETWDRVTFLPLYLASAFGAK